MRHAKRILPSSAIVLAVAVLSSASTCMKGPRPWTPGRPQTAAQLKEFDLVAGPTDYNGFLVSPKWASQAPGVLPPKMEACKRRPFDDVCTTQKPTLDEARFPNVVICSFEFGSQIRGHANWAVASSVGELLWLNLATDGDYNFMFFPEGDAGLTGNNGLSTGRVEGPARRFIELEFDSRETAAQFATKWWNDFDQIVRKGDFAAIQKALNPQAPQVAARAVVSGLFGLDCEHDCHSEFHPLYAVGIEVDTAPSHNTWAIFVRNSGNEGFCSSLDHHVQLHEQTFRLTLPRRGTRPRVTSASTQFASSVSAGSSPAILFPEVAFDTATNNEGQVVLSFTLPAPDKRANADMVLTLDWPSSPTVPTELRYAPGTPARALTPPQPPETESPEEYLERALGSKGVAPSAVVASALGVRAKPRNVVVATPATVPVVDFRRPTIRAAPPRGRLKAAADKHERDKALVERLCTAYKDDPLPAYNGRDVRKDQLCRK